MLDGMTSTELTAWQQFFLVKDEKDTAYRKQREWERKNHFED